MTDAEVAEWMAHPGVAKSLYEILAGLRYAASQTITDDAKTAIEDGMARLVAACTHANQWKSLYDAVSAAHHYEHTFRTELEGQLVESHRRVAELEGF